MRPSGGRSRGYVDRLIVWRYPILVLWSAAWFEVSYHHAGRGLSDWLWFEFAARTMIHLNSHYATGSLQLYAHYPVVQIGPPPLAIVASLQWLPPHVVEQVIGLAMAAAGVACLRSAEVIANARLESVRSPRLRPGVMSAGLVAVAFWSWDVGRWQHLDDVLVITLVLAAMALIASGRVWWLAAVMVGLAVASKPWALVLTPVLMGLPREKRSAAALVTMLSAALPWAPFVLADHSTPSALAGFHFTVDPRAALHTLGMPLGVAPNWARPLQLLGGFILAMVAARKGRWAAIPLVALGFRVVSDPQSWAYYGLGPLMGALLWDIARGRRWPVLTSVTAVAEFGVRAFAPSWSGPVQLIWFAAAMAVVVLGSGAAPDAAPRPEEPVVSHIGVAMATPM